MEPIMPPLGRPTIHRASFSCVVGLALIAACAGLQPRPDRALPPLLRTHVVLLGTGTPNADPDRSGPAVAIVVDSSAYIVDAGPGIVRRAAAAARTTKFPALEQQALRIVFLTHLHSDHTLGLPDLMFSPWVLGRTTPLDVYGPPGTRAMVEHLQAAYGEDIEMRLHGGEPSNKTGYGAVAHEVALGVAYRDALVTVTAFAVPHGAWPHAYGYRVQTPDRVIVISGDTRASDAVADACNGCDVLVHEIISAEHLKERTPDWRAYHTAYHTLGYDVGGVAAKARPTLLVLYHQLPMGVADDVLLREVRQRYRGVVVSGRDLGVY
jgi:ribonuclease BN (tRNA processing enzyme)